MDNEKTKYKKNSNMKKLVLLTIHFTIITILFGFYIIRNVLKVNKPIGIMICILIALIVIFGFTGAILGLIKGKRQLLKESKYLKKTNPYLYYRELPNNFGIGVATLLIDSTIENYKDIVAVILDLCAKKYLSLIKQNDKYIIKILKNADDSLLSNEKYILNLLKDNNIKNIDYQEWYKYCMQDGIDLGLFYHQEIPVDNGPLLTKKIIKKRSRIHLTISIIIGVINFGLFLFKGNLLDALAYGVVWFGIIYVLLIVPFYVINVFTGIKNLGKQAKIINYKNVIENILTKTQKGVEEYQKLYSFKAFIRDFGHFVDKKVDEVILWDRYLSYAQVFGLTKEIMDSGYHKLIENSSFQIDNIDKINLDNIEIDYN